MLTNTMNSRGPFGRWARSISRTFGVKRRAMLNSGYYLIPLSEHLMRSSRELFKSCNIVQCGHQKRFFVLRSGCWGECKNELKYFSDVFKHSGNGAANGRIKNSQRGFCTTATLPATAAFTTHGDGDVDMGSKEFLHNLETYSRYQPCPVSIGNLTHNSY